MVKFVWLEVIPEEGLRFHDCPSTYPLAVNPALVISVEPSLLKMNRTHLPRLQDRRGGPGPSKVTDKPPPKPSGWAFSCSPPLGTTCHFCHHLVYGNSPIAVLLRGDNWKTPTRWAHRHCLYDHDKPPEPRKRGFP